MEEETPYILQEDGIPSLGFENEYLIIVSTIENPLTPGMRFGYLGFKPMHDEIEEINVFYNTERRNLTLLLIIILAGSIIVISLITFLVLNYLIRKRITKPIDELSAGAEEVMQGNLDVEIKVRKGEEFEGLKKAFNEMVEGIRKYIDKSVSEE